jgi:hypothetical protein
MSATVLAFPAQTTCDVCGRSCSEDDLGGCFTCDTRFCDKCAECKCDKEVAELAARMSDLEPGLITGLVSFARRLAQNVRGKIASYRVAS